MPEGYPGVKTLFSYHDTWRKKSETERAELTARAKEKFQIGEVYYSRSQPTSTNFMRLKSIDDNGEVTMKHFFDGSEPQIFLEEFMDLNPDARPIPEAEWLRSFGG